MYRTLATMSNRYPEDNAGGYDSKINSTHRPLFASRGRGQVHHALKANPRRLWVAGGREGWWLLGDELHPRLRQEA